MIATFGILFTLSIIPGYDTRASSPSRKLLLYVDSEAVLRLLFVYIVVYQPVLHCFRSYFSDPVKNPVIRNVFRRTYIYIYIYSAGKWFCLSMVCLYIDVDRYGIHRDRLLSERQINIVCCAFSVEIQTEK